MKKGRYFTLKSNKKVFEKNVNKKIKFFPKNNLEQKN